MTKRRTAKLAGFLALAACIVAVTSALFTPSFRDLAGYNDETVRGLYNQPENTVQVAFLGTSSILSGISPMALYEDCGICSYNVGTRAQPFIMSYYLLKDVERRNPQTLSTVVIDPSYLFHTSTAMSRVEETIQYMDPSLVKLEALLASRQYYSGFSFTEHLIPVLRYHSRWNELTPFDFERLVKGDGALNFSRHGYFARFSSNVDYEGTDIKTTKNDAITEEITHTEDEIVQTYDRGKEYLDKIVDFCNEKDINLVFLKIPKANWDSLSHDAMQKAADDYGVPFIDMDLNEIWDECDLSYDTDYVDNRHPNVIGATKISDYIGRYLVDEFGIEDVRDNASYQFMEADVERYHKDLENAQLMSCTNFEEYLDMLGRERYTTFVTVRSEATEGLTDSARAKLSALGLEGLATLQKSQSYLAIMENGKMVLEKKNEEGKTSKLRRAFDGKNLVTRGHKMQTGAMVENEITLVSIGGSSGAKSGVFRPTEAENVEDTNLSENKKGINFVVYDHETGDLIDTSSFNTHKEGCPRTSDLSKQDEDAVE